MDVPLVDYSRRRLGMGTFDMMYVLFRAVFFFFFFLGGKSLSGSMEVNSSLFALLGL